MADSETTRFADLHFPNIIREPLETISTECCVRYTRSDATRTHRSIHRNGFERFCCKTLLDLGTVTVCPPCCDPEIRIHLFDIQTIRHRRVSPGFDKGMWPVFIIRVEPFEVNTFPTSQQRKGHPRATMDDFHITALMTSLKSPYAPQGTCRSSANGPNYSKGRMQCV